MSSAHRAFEEAEARHEEIRQPYEQAMQQAQVNYEAKRQEYLRMVEEMREQLDKAPDEYRQRFDEILAQYNAICAEEKEQSDRRRRPAYPRHRAAREPAHRQSIARPRGASRRSRIFAILSVPGRRS